MVFFTDLPRVSRRGRLRRSKRVKANYSILVNVTKRSTRSAPKTRRLMKTLTLHSTWVSARGDQESKIYITDLFFYNAIRTCFILQVQRDSPHLLTRNQIGTIVKEKIYRVTSDASLQVWQPVANWSPFDLGVPEDCVCGKSQWEGDETFAWPIVHAINGPSDRLYHAKSNDFCFFFFCITRIGIWRLRTKWSLS